MASQHYLKFTKRIRVILPDNVKMVYKGHVRVGDTIVDDYEKIDTVGNYHGEGHTITNGEALIYGRIWKVFR